jgi:hypothetical protein
MVLNKDFKEFIKLLNENDVKYLIVGGYAVGFHGYPRYTKDLDIWLLVSEVNAQKVIKEDFLKTDEFVQLGYPPNRIDIVTSCDGVEFNKCFEEKIETVIDGVNMYFINFENLKKNKKATGRPQDLADLDNLGKNKI